jgi:hypothetical protein
MANEQASVMAADARSADPRNGTMLGVVFDAEALGVSRAVAGAWQMWMERLDPAEMHGVALYDGLMTLAGGQHIVIIAVSGSPQPVAYVRDAFAAPDLLAFPGIAPVSHRFIGADQLPREQLTMRGYIDATGQFIPADPQSPLIDIARHAEWPFATLKVPASHAPSARRRPPPADADERHTQHIRALDLDGATRVMMRLWRAPSITEVHKRQRTGLMLRLMGIAIAVTVIVASVTVLAGTIIQASGRSTNKPDPVTIAPLSLRVPCTPGVLTQFTITNDSTGTISWSSNGTSFEPPLSLSAVSGTLLPGDSQVVQITTIALVVPLQSLALTVTAASSTIMINITYGGCTPPPGS